MFIKVTEIIRAMGTMRADRFVECDINVENLERVVRDDSSTTLCLVSGATIEVKETIEELRRQYAHDAT